MKDFALYRPKDFHRMLGRLAIKLNENDQDLSIIKDVINNSSFDWRTGAYKVWVKFLDGVEKAIKDEKH